MASHSFDHDPSEPLALFVRNAETPAAFGDARCLRFEFSSRGDRVPGRLLLPAHTRGPAPVLLFQHGVGGHKAAPYMETAAPWVRGGVAIASIDFPLHGERASAKLSERLTESIASSHHMDASGEILWTEFGRQSVLDLRRCADALAELPGVDPQRIGYAGFSLGAIVGAVFCGVDRRPRAAALALAGGGFGPAAVDPCHHIAGFAPRPVLFVNASADEVVGRAATEALYEAAGGPKSIHWYDTSHGDLPGVALKTMWLFIQEHLLAAET